MKIIKKSGLLAGLSLLSLAGCTSVQTNPIYNAWQAQAYGAYGMTPNSPYRTTPYYPNNSRVYTYMPQNGYVSSPIINVSAPVSRGEQQYIAQHYGLQ